MNGDTIQTIVVALIVAFAAVMLWRSLRRGGSDSCDPKASSGSRGSCGECPLKDDCNKPHRKDIKRSTYNTHK